MEQLHIINDQNNSLELAKVAEPALSRKHRTELITFSFLPKFVGKLQRCIFYFVSFLGGENTTMQKIIDGESDSDNGLCLVKKSSSIQSRGFSGGDLVLIHLLSPLSTDLEMNNPHKQIQSLNYILKAALWVQFLKLF